MNKSPDLWFFFNSVNQAYDYSYSYDVIKFSVNYIKYIKMYWIKTSKNQEIVNNLKVLRIAQKR